MEKTSYVSTKSTPFNKVHLSNERLGYIKQTKRYSLSDNLHSFTFPLLHTYKCSAHISYKINIF